MTNLDRLCGAIKCEEDALLAAGHRRAFVHRRILATNARQARRRGLLQMRAVLVLGVACMVIGAAGAWLWHSGQPQPVTAAVGESRTPISAGAWLSASESTSLPLRFSDGSRVDIAPRSRMRLTALGTQGAELALESGSAGVDISHGEHRKWGLRAGQFVVHVTGTRFDVSWNPAEDRFELVLDEGQVEITGCGFGAGRKLVAGQKVHASCRENRVDIAYVHETLTPSSRSHSSQAADLGAANEEVGKVAGDSPASVTNRMPADARGAAASSTTNSSTANAGAVKSLWLTLAQQGKYKEAVEALERLGFAAECARSQPAELALLGDTARHARDFDKARLAFLQLRQRFAGSSQAGVAAFSLGVIEFDQARAYAKAAQWFRTYIKENPAGPLTREARGRLMEVLHRSESSEARRLASDYLRDYPTGPHAELAQRIVQAL